MLIKKEEQEQDFLANFLTSNPKISEFYSTVNRTNLSMYFDYRKLSPYLVSVGADYLYEENVELYSLYFSELTATSTQKLEDRLALITQEEGLTLLNLSTHGMEIAIETRKKNEEMQFRIFPKSHHYSMSTWTSSSEEERGLDPDLKTAINQYGNLKWLNKEQIYKFFQELAALVEESETEQKLTRCRSLLGFGKQEDFLNSIDNTPIKSVIGYKHYPKIDLSKLNLLQGHRVENPKLLQHCGAILYEAAVRSPELFERFLALGAKINSADADSLTALDHATINGRVDIAERLIKEGASLHKSYSGRTTLHYAAQYGQTQIMALGLQMEEAHSILSADTTGEIIQIAILGKHIDIVKLLTEKAQGYVLYHHEVVLRTAICKGGAAISSYLLNVIKEKINPDTFINKQNKTDALYTLLHYAVKENDEEIVKLLLLQPNINVNLEDMFGNTPLSIALGKNNPNIIVQLLKRNSRVDDELLEKTFSRLDAYEFKLLLPHLHFREDTQWNSRYPLHLIIERENDAWNEVLEEILVRDDININKQAPITPLNYAIGINNAKAVSILLNNQKTDVNVVSGGSSPLVYALMLDNELIIDLLLSHPRISMDLQQTDEAIAQAIRAQKSTTLAKLLKHPQIKVDLDVLPLVFGHPHNTLRMYHAAPHLFLMLLKTQGVVLSENKYVKQLRNIPEFNKTFLAAKLSAELQKSCWVASLRWNKFRGADLNFEDNQSNTLLYYAITGKNIHCANYLISQKANLALTESNADKFFQVLDTLSKRDADYILKYAMEKNALDAGLSPWLEQNYIKPKDFVGFITFISSKNELPNYAIKFLTKENNTFLRELCNFAKDSNQLQVIEKLLDLARTNGWGTSQERISFFNKPSEEDTLWTRHAATILLNAKMAEKNLNIDFEVDDTVLAIK